MADMDQRSPGERLLMALDLFEAGPSMKRASLRRALPDTAPEEIDRFVREWLATRPGAPYGDGPGVPRSPGPQR